MIASTMSTVVMSTALQPREQPQLLPNGGLFVGTLALKLLLDAAHGVRLSQPMGFHLFGVAGQPFRQAAPFDLANGALEREPMLVVSVVAASLIGRFVGRRCVYRVRGVFTRGISW